jgi:Gluconate 2-dehydrogenase subunit 3
MNWTPQRRLTLGALIDRIIPADDFPSASQNGVGKFIEGILGAELAYRAEEVLLGLQSLEDEATERFKTPFTGLSAKQQDELLRDIEAGESLRAVWGYPARRFFELMVTLTNEGYYASPNFGANPQMISWKMIGYETGVPATPVKEHWLEAGNE